MSGDPVKAIKFYAKGEYEGSLMDLLDLFSNKFRYKYYIENKKLDGFIKGFFDNRNLCKNNCNQCNYCKTYTKKSVVLDEHAISMQESSKLFDGYLNEYKQMVRSISSNSEEEMSKIDNELELNFNL